MLVCKIQNDIDVLLHSVLSTGLMLPFTPLQCPGSHLEVSCHGGRKSPELSRAASVQTYEDNPELAAWAKRQRVARTHNSLSDERLQVLASAGFEFGELGAITNEWEDMFDQLLEWLMVKVSLQTHRAAGLPDRRSSSFGLCG